MPPTATPDPTCEIKIRPLRPISEVELQCEYDPDHDGEIHGADLKDYAYPGSVTRVTWLTDDRRTFVGDFQVCHKTLKCILPANHARDCAE